MLRQPRGADDRPAVRLWRHRDCMCPPLLCPSMLLVVLVSWPISPGFLWLQHRFTRTGVPGVFGPTVGNGLPLTEITVAEHLKSAGYRTAAMGALRLLILPALCFSLFFLFFCLFFVRLWARLDAWYAKWWCRGVGKWHLGQRPMFLPAARGFDYYLGIPFSDDMGEGRRTSCSNYTADQASVEHTEQR